MPAQIRVVFKTKGRNKERTYLKDFSIVYDEEAQNSRAVIKTPEEIEDGYEESLYRFDKMQPDTSVLSTADAINNLCINYAGNAKTVHFPLYRYKGQDVYDERDMQRLYDSADRRLLVYPDVGQQIRSAASAAAASAREDLIARLLAVSDGAAESSVL